MNVTNSCGNCGNPLHSNDPGGICPNCLMGHAFSNEAENPTTDASGFSYPRAEELVGRLPHLEILHLIGHGGMGAVYLARQTKLDRLVALKVLSPRLGNDPAFAERFMREAKTLARLSHTNIVTVFDYGQTESLNYLVMEYVDGVNLRDAIQEGKLTPQESLAIVPQICDALQYAHDNGVIHRDIKPENVLIDKQGRVKIADFGLAKLLQPNREDFTLTGTQQVLGTRNYMAPEQIEKPEVVDHRADIYSLGVVFYELLTGELPIGRFAAPSEKAPVTNRLDDVVLRTLEKEPERRFQQASEIRTAVESLPSYESPAPPPEPAPQGPTPTGPTPTDKAIVSLPFTIGDVYQGFASAHGIAHLYNDRLELEYEVVDEFFGAVKSSTRQVKLPLASLATVRFIKGMFSDRINFQMERLEDAKDIPNSKQGRFTLGTKRAEIDSARKLVDQIDLICHTGAHHAAPPEFAKPKPQEEKAPPQEKSETWRKSIVLGMGISENASRAEVIQALKIPALGFMAIGIIHVILGAIRLLKSDQWRMLEPFETSLFSGVEISIYLPTFDGSNIRTIIMLAIGILMLSISSRLRRPRNYVFVYAALIGVIFAPVHFAYVLTLIFAIWALVVLSDSRCREVYFGDDEDGSQRSWNPLAIFGYLFAFGLSILSILFAVGLIAVLIFNIADRKRDSQSQKPDAIEETQKANSMDGSTTDSGSSGTGKKSSSESGNDSNKDSDSESDKETKKNKKPDSDSGNDGKKEKADGHQKLP